MHDDSTIKTCADCGAKKVKYRHHLNKGLMDGLYKVYRFSNCGSDLVILGNIGLTRSQVDNFQKLKYWGLVWSPSRGFWQITTLGKDFIELGLGLSSVAITYRGVVTSFDGHFVTFEGLAPLYYRQAEEYAMDAEPMP